MMADGDDVVGWRVHLIQPLETVSNIKSDHYSVDFKTKEEADAYKRKMQAEGWVANTSPFLPVAASEGKMRKTTQGRAAPPGFNADWRLHGSAPPVGADSKSRERG